IRWRLARTIWSRLAIMRDQIPMIIREARIPLLFFRSLNQRTGWIRQGVRGSEAIDSMSQSNPASEGDLLLERAKIKNRPPEEADPNMNIVIRDISNSTVPALLIG